MTVFKIIFSLASLVSLASLFTPFFMPNPQDEKNIGKIKETIEKKIISPITDKLKDELEQEAAVLLQRQMNNAKRETTNDISNDMAASLTLDDQKKKNIKDRSIRQTLPENLAETQSAPDNIYRPEEKKEKEEGREKDEEEKKGKEEAPEKGEAAEEKKKKDEPEAPKTNEETVAPDKTPEWQNQEPTTSEGGMARADTGDISQKKKPEEKPFDSAQGKLEEKKRNRDLSREQRLARIKQHKEKKAQKKKDEAKKTEEKAEANIGKMTPLSFGLWLFLAIMADILSLIPYVGLIFSWPFATVFAIYKWRIKIKKELAIATTALDFFFEGLLSTLPVNTVDVILTFVLSNNATTRAITKKISSATSAKK